MVLNELNERWGAGGGGVAAVAAVAAGDGAAVVVAAWAGLGGTSGAASDAAFRIASPNFSRISENICTAAAECCSSVEFGDWTTAAILSPIGSRH